MHVLLERIRNLRILVIGDVILDHYLWGDASRISPEAPVPIVQVERDTFTAGGAANVALNLRALGVGVELAGVAGQDAEGRRLQELLQRAGVSFDPALCLPEVPTIVKTRVMCRNQQLCRLDRERSPRCYGLPPVWQDAALKAHVAAADAVIISDYAKGVVTSDLIRRVQASAGPAKLVSLDPKPRPDLDFEDIGLLTPNRNEALQLCGLPSTGLADFRPEEVCRRIHSSYAPRLLVVTLGPDGMLISTGGHVQRQVPTAARAVFDVSGAGDTVVAVLTAALATGATPDEAVQIANLAAGVVVGKVGTATATAAEILAHGAPA